LAATNNDLNSSADGLTWKPFELAKRMPWSYCRGLGQKVGNPEVVLLGMGDWTPGSVGTILRSANGGEDWQEVLTPQRANSTIWSFAVHPADDNRIYANSVSGEIYRSEDSGLTWTKLDREFGEIRSLAWTP
jgi:photosystem II stability/assembly factor-like uncharacterized protein